MQSGRLSSRNGADPAECASGAPPSADREEERMPVRAVSPVTHGTVRTATAPALAALALAALALAGCSGDDGGDLPDFEGSTPGATGSATPGASASGSGGAAAEGPARLVVDDADRPADGKEKAAYDAYVAFWRADVEALGDPSKGSAAVRKLAADPQRRRTLVDLEKMRVNEQKSIGTLTIAPRVVTVENREATLSDCLDDTAMSTVDKDGQKVEGTGGKRVRLDVTMSLVQNAWVVSDLQGGSGAC
jgi:hypothetical protein